MESTRRREMDDTRAGLVRHWLKNGINNYPSHSLANLAVLPTKNTAAGCKDDEPG